MCVFVRIYIYIYIYIYACVGFYACIAYLFSCVFARALVCICVSVSRLYKVCMYLPVHVHVSCCVLQPVVQCDAHSTIGSVIDAVAADHA